MAKEKGAFKEFLSPVAPEHQAFVEELNNKLIEHGCNLVIKEAKSGFGELSGSPVTATGFQQRPGLSGHSTEA